jgi:CBS domain-containing protein
MATWIRTLSLADVSVGSIMKREVRTVATTKPLVESLKIMKEYDIGSIVIVGDENRPVGIFTERDLVRKMAEKRENLELPIGQVMSKPLVTILSKSTIWDALTLMGKHDIRRLPVIEEADGKSKLVGIVTERDVFRLIIAHQSVLLETVSESIPASRRETLKGIVGQFGIEEKPPSRM